MASTATLPFADYRWPGIRIPTSEELAAIAVTLSAKELQAASSAQSPLLPCFPFHQGEAHTTLVDKVVKAVEIAHEGHSDPDAGRRIADRCRADSQGGQIQGSRQRCGQQGQMCFIFPNLKRANRL